MCMHMLLSTRRPLNIFCRANSSATDHSNAKVSLSNGNEHSDDRIEAPPRRTGPTDRSNKQPTLSFRGTSKSAGEQAIRIM
ncbi:hypothetical protein FOL46_005302 [Perkinsus olseni]|uniref:Uncharacterized protein n=1 Tax=Perkinsus olseni TaxID=32597 RepID=A0A7J6MRU2_PEROL|nr:hypothetical protein FOL46_005302 [Perkinsus olseni]